jgi:hypothetical protein
MRHAKHVDANIAAFIRQREREAHRAGSNAANERARIWQESAERYRQAKDEDRRTAWAEYHARLSDLHAALADDHAQQAAKLVRTEERDLG